MSAPTMAVRKPTPGPWRFCGCGKCGLVWSASRDIVVADAGITGDEGAEVPHEEIQANARLMAAAPDLLEALEASLPILEHDLPPAPNHHCGGPDGMCGGECVDYARASTHLRSVRDAIAKARGRR